MTYEKNDFAEYLAEEDKEKYRMEDQEVTARLDERYIPLEIPEDVKRELAEFQDTIANKLINYGLPDRLTAAEIDYVGYKYVQRTDTDQFSLNGENVDNHVVIAISAQTPNLMSKPQNLALLKEVTAHELAHYVRKDIVGKRYMQAQFSEGSEIEVWEQVSKTNLGFENLTRRTNIEKEDAMQTTGGLWNEPMAIFFSLDCLDDPDYQATTQYDEHIPFIATLINEYAARNNIEGNAAFRELFKLYAEHQTEFFSKLVDTFGNREIKELNNVRSERSPINPISRTTELEHIANMMGIKQKYLDNVVQFRTEGIAVDGINGRVKQQHIDII